MYYINNEIIVKDKFDMCKFLEVTEDGTFDSLNSFMLYQIPLLPVQGYYKIRTEIERPDLLSYNIYGETQYWWILMWYNQLLSPKDLTVGREIKYPSVNALNQLYINASLYQKTVNQS